MQVKNLEAFREIKYNDKKNGETNYDFDKIVEVSKKEPNYYDEQTKRNVRYYDRIILISEIFGRSLEVIVQEGIQAKLNMVPESVRYKLGTTITKIVNKGSNNLIAIVL